jgi:hypothetical protein
VGRTVLGEQSAERYLDLAEPYRLGAVLLEPAQRVEEEQRVGGIAIAGGGAAP